jgi:DNA-binding CsgD family transcriptional regulator
LSKNALTLDEIINGYVIKSDPILASLLHEAAMRHDAIFYSISLKDKVFEYTSPSSINLIGYSPEDFRLGGADFLFKILDESSIHDNIEKQVEINNRVKNPAFDPRAELVDEFYTPIKTRAGEVVPLVSLATVLLFTESAIVEYTLCLLCVNNDKTIAECKALLLAMKKRHNEIYNHPPFIRQNNPLDVIYVTSQQIDKKVTGREAEVLSYLAKGFSTEEISNALGITTHTVETHRKKLLQKFEAKNSAELIKKASKVYWLE